MSLDVGIWRTELRRGLVELCVLAVLRDGEAYGYQIVEQLKRDARMDFTESTVYPVLARLHRDKYLTERRVRSAAGPPRRYFCLTETGRQRLEEMVCQWNEVSDRIRHLIHKGVA
ncbi:MAG: PadR family transcriptional regulator [Pirellulaceae bacterium]|nr:PadR family transcriptional regulator [Planctomycetales bacterium]